MSTSTDTASRDTSSREGARPRVRPVTWAILAWMLVMIAAIVGAWQGSESRYGAIPEVTVTTREGEATVLPYSAGDLDGTTYSNPVTEVTVRHDETIGVRLPVELRRTTLNVYEMREAGGSERTIEADTTGSLRLPATTEEGGRLEGLVVRGIPMVYTASGEESILNGEWSVGFLFED